MSRTAEISRKTRETEVKLALDLDGGEVSASTGVGFLDHMLELLGRHGRLGLGVEAKGDLETGAHHTVEDVGIALGQAIDRALEQALVNSERVLLLVTGHARPGDPPIQRGRIRAAVHDWLAASRHRERIAAVRGAHRRHGGGGSLYVILRR